MNLEHKDNTWEFYHHKLEKNLWFQRLQFANDKFSALFKNFGPERPGPVHLKFEAVTVQPDKKFYLTGLNWFKILSIKDLPPL